MLLHEVAHEVCPTAPIAVLSGPTFAHEVAAGLPTAVTLACEDAGARRGAARADRPARLPHLSVRRRRRRRGRRRGQERARHRLRRGRGARARPECARRADRARLRRDDPLRPRHGRAARDAGRPVGPRRPRADLLVDQLAQFLARQGDRRGRATPPSCWPTAAPSPKARYTAPVLQRVAAASAASTCRSSPRSARCSRASVERSTRCSKTHARAARPATRTTERDLEIDRDALLLPVAVARRVELVLFALGRRRRRPPRGAGTGGDLLTDAPGGFT